MNPQQAERTARVALALIAVLLLGLALMCITVAAAYNDGEQRLQGLAYLLLGIAWAWLSFITWSAR